MIIRPFFLQIKQAISYTDEHLDPDGLYELQVYKFNDRIIQVKIQSRHESKKFHKLWIEYDGQAGSIEGWYCTCKTGARTLGCCAHVASVLWRLGYDRHIHRKERQCRSYGNHVMDAEDCLKDNEETADWTDSNGSTSEEESDE